MIDRSGETRNESKAVMTHRSPKPSAGSSRGARRFGLLRESQLSVRGKGWEKRMIDLSGETRNESKAVMTHRSPKPSA
jgi:hypothetical protein